MSALKLSETLSERSRTVCHISLDLMSHAELSQRRLTACESESRSLTALMRPLFHNRLSICSSARSHSRSSLRHKRVIYKSAWTYSTTRFSAPSVNDSVGRDDQSFQSVFYKNDPLTSSPLVEHLKPTLCHLPVIVSLQGRCLLLIIGYRVKIQDEDLLQRIMLEIKVKTLLNAFCHMWNLFSGQPAQINAALCHHLWFSWGISCFIL